MACINGRTLSWLLINIANEFLQCTGINFAKDINTDITDYIMRFVTKEVKSKCVKILFYGAVKAHNVFLETDD